VLFRSVDVLAKLFDSLLDVAVLDAGGVAPRKVAFDLGELLNQVGDDFALVAEASGVELRVAETSLVVRSDPILVRRIVQNLISNATRHAERGRVLVGARRRGDSVAIEVHDTGRGVSEQDLARIFDEFTRLAPERMGPRATPGLGLGLSIVRRLVDVLGLEVEVRSRVGVGSSFVVHGLVRAYEAPQRTMAAQEPALTGLDAITGLRVLVIDDDGDARQAMGEILERWGCVVTLSAGEDWDATAVQDVALCDYELGPELTGVQAAVRARADFGADLSVILISGHTGEAVREVAMRERLPLLQKPVRPGQLRSALLAAAVSAKAVGGGERSGGGASGDAETAQ